MRVPRQEPPPPRPHCPYCNQAAQLLRLADAGYPYQVDNGPIWTCVPCHAWVACHANSKRHVPLGRLADADLRRAKMRVHEVFDPIWRAKMAHDACTQFVARNAGYKWLAEQMGIDVKLCNIAMFSSAQCEFAIVIMKDRARARRFICCNGDKSL